jgi:hypothetical protein
MYKRTIETSESPHVTVEECRGNLTVRAGVEDEVSVIVHAEEDEVVLEQEGNSVSLVFPEHATVTCPPRTVLVLERMLGNLTVEGVDGSLTGGTVRGNARMHDVGSLALDEVFGNMSARGVGGELRGREVRGNARVAGVSGRLSLQEVRGNLTVEGIEGGLSVEKARGNARLGPPFVAGAEYNVEAGGNLSVQVEPDASLHLRLKAGGHLSSRVNGLELERNNGWAEGTLGAGEATLKAKAGGNLSVSPADEDEPFEAAADLEGLSAQIEWQVNEAMAKMTSRLEESLGRVDSSAIRERVDRATEQARRKAERAAERARLRAERAERRWRRVSGRPERSEEASATDEERLRVLRMVEEGRLTPEQASELLAALEGE